MSETIVNVRDLSKRFGSVVAVDKISFDLARGSTVGLLGGNGAGKTSTLGMLLGLLLPSSGGIKIFGEDMIRHRHRVLPWMNFSSPYVDLPHRLTVRENLVVYGRLYGVPRIKSRINQLARDFSLLEFLDRPAGKLSAIRQSSKTLCERSHHKRIRAALCMGLRTG